MSLFLLFRSGARRFSKDDDDAWSLWRRVKPGEAMTRWMSSVGRGRNNYKKKKNYHKSAEIQRGKLAPERTTPYRVVVCSCGFSRFPVYVCGLVKLCGNKVINTFDPPVGISPTAADILHANKINFPPFSVCK